MAAAAEYSAARSAVPGLLEVQRQGLGVGRARPLEGAGETTVVSAQLFGGQTAHDRLPNSVVVRLDPVAIGRFPNQVARDEDAQDVVLALQARCVARYRGTQRLAGDREQLQDLPCALGKAPDP